MSGLIVDAVTAILVFESEIFMMRRSPELLAFPGYDAFPGGKVDTGDALPRAFDHAQLAGFDNRLIQALVRELIEELAFDLPAALADGTATSISLCGHALTPPTFPRRFNTYFFIVRLSRRPDFVVDAREAAHSAWAPAAQWMQEWLDGARLIAPPTLACLDALQADLHCQQIRDVNVERWSRTGIDPGDGEGLPVLQSVHGVRHLFVRSNTLPPAEHTNCFVIGDAGSPCIAIDPSPRDEAELLRLERSLLVLGVDRILITHHHSDHHQYADDLARRNRWPLLMSPRTQARIGEGRPGFMDGLEILLVDDGDEITRWLGHAVRVLAVPGHDDGQLAPMPDNRAWCIVGDLIQGVGTVVIRKPEGNMRQYFESLQKIIDLKPGVIFPSHGVGMGTAFRLEETLRHRRKREEHVLELRRSGLDVEQMLATIYTDLDPRLLPLARQNIESHLDKLTDEGLLPA